MMFTQEQWIALLPILLTASTSIVVMLAIAIKRHHWWNSTISVIGSNVAVFPTYFAAHTGPLVITPLLVVDRFAAFYMALILVITLATATLMHAYLEGHKGNKEEMYLMRVIAARGPVTRGANIVTTEFTGKWPSGTSKSPPKLPTPGKPSEAAPKNSAIGGRYEKRAHRPPILRRSRVCRRS